MTKIHVDSTSNKLFEFIEPPGAANKTYGGTSLRDILATYIKAFTSCITASVEAFFIVH